jgi:hypothetical protein
VRHRAPRAPQRCPWNRHLGELAAVEMVPHGLAGDQRRAQPGHRAGYHGAVRAQRQPGRVGFESGQQCLAVRAGRRAGLALQPPRGSQVEPGRRAGRSRHHEQVRPGGPDNRAGDVGRRLAPDHHVGLVRGEHRPHPLAAADLEPQVDARVRAEERGELIRQQVLARGCHRRDTDPAALRVRPGPGGGQRLLMQAEDLPRVPGVGLPGPG